MPSGRMAYELKYFGATTGRWSGGGGLNLQNLNRKTAEGVDLRRAIVAPPGRVLGVVDYSQIESRVLLYLAGDVTALSLFRANPDADAYEIHARSTMGYAEAEPLKAYCDRAGSNLRQLAKARVELLLGVLAHAAGVDGDDVGLDILGRRLVTGLIEEPCHPLRVVDVHLAAERLDEVFPGHS